MESKQLFITLLYFLIVNAQLISSARQSTKIRKIRLPSCECQNIVGGSCGCTNIIPNPPYNCGCGNPSICRCPKYWDQIEIPSCSFEMTDAFAFDIPSGSAPEKCSCRSAFTLPLETTALNPFGCQAARKPCLCQLPTMQPGNVYELLTFMDVPCGCQSVFKLTSFDYVPCGCGVSPCGCGISQCGCQIPRDGALCGCRTNGMIPNYIPAIDPITAIFPGLGVPYTCGCDGRFSMFDMPCGCQVFSNPSSCNCGCQRCGFGCGCGCGFECAPRCECGGKYLRQITLQPPFL